MSQWKNILRDEATSHIENDYEIGHVLGQGSFGIVRLAKNRKNGELVACKSISKAKLMSAADVEDVRREVEILHLVSPHRSIAGVNGVYEDRSSVHIMMEFCAGGELFDRIVKKGTFSEAEAARFFRQMVEVVHHCHTCGVMHRDIKPENFLLSNESDNCDLKACDFGLSDFFKPGQNFSSLIGSAYYVAPEVLRRKYGPACDVWSLGVVLFILLSGSPPFWGNNEKEIFVQVLKGTLNFSVQPWPTVSDAAKDLVSKMLTLNPEDRPTTGEMLQHPWLKVHGVAPTKPLDSVVIKRMKDFASMNRIRKAAVLVAAKHLGKEEISGLRELFKSFDENGDGVISLEELAQGLKAQGGIVSQEELEKLMKETDVDGSGAIDYEEFLAATVNHRLLEREEVLQKLFVELDVDKSGTLTVDEIETALATTALGCIDREEVIELVKNADVNGDGVIDFDEFVVMWRRQNSEELHRAASSLRGGLSENMLRLVPMDVDVLI